MTTDPKPLKYRKLRIVWSVGWGVVAVLLCVLWVRSYWINDSALFTLPRSTGIQLVSINGSFQVLVVDTTTMRLLYGGWPKWETRKYEIKEPSYTEFLLTFQHKRFETGDSFIFPQWLPLLLCGMFASLSAIPWLRLRFSLRTLLIATTLIAVVLGIIVWMSRAG